jgi:hypothetical protein
MPLRQRKKIQKVLRKTTGLIAVVVLLFWLASMGQLLYREVIAPSLYSASVRPRQARPQDLWMGIYVSGNERAGFVNLRGTPEPREGEPGYRLAMTARLEMPVMGFDAQLFLSGSAYMSEAHGLSDFDFTFKSGDHHLRVEGTAEAGVLKGTLHTAGEQLPLRFPIGDRLLLSGGMGMPALDVPLLRPGETIYADAFDPTTMSVGRAKLTAIAEETLEVAGEAIECIIIETVIGGMSTRAWVTREEEVIRAETPFGFTLMKIAPEEALAPVQPSETASLVRTLAVRPEGMTPRTGASRMLVKISGVEERQLPPSTPVQTRTPDGYLVTMLPEPPLPLPDELSPEERAENLASDAVISAEHETIRQAAREIAGDETDPWRLTIMLHDWVYTEIEKQSIITIPTALDVLRTRQGDCNEHAVLYVALARALGLPARIAIGIVWSNELGAFGYHAWAEVHIGEWIPVDPALGQPIADATHIKLLNGSIDKWTQLLPYIGQLRLEVIEIE